MEQPDYEKYRKYAFGVAVRVLGDKYAAEDVAQRAMLIAFKRVVKEGPTAKPFIRRVTRGLCVDYVREQELGVLYGSVSDARTAKDAEGWVESIEEIVHRHELATAIRRGVSLLPPMQRKVFEMRRLGYRRKEIAEELRIGDETTKDYLKCSYESMRNYLIAWGFSPNEPLPGKNPSPPKVSPQTD